MDPSPSQDLQVLVRTACIDKNKEILLYQYSSRLQMPMHHQYRAQTPTPSMTIATQKAKETNLKRRVNDVKQTPIPDDS